MRKLRALAISTALAAGLTLSISTAPAAHAESIRYVYWLQPDCIYGGNFGIQAGWWTTFRCSYQYFGPNSPTWVLWA